MDWRPKFPLSIQHKNCKIEVKNENVIIIDYVCRSKLFYKELIMHAQDVINLSCFFVLLSGIFTITVNNFTGPIPPELGNMTKLS